MRRVRRRRRRRRRKRRGRGRRRRGGGGGDISGEVINQIAKKYGNCQFLSFS